VQILAGLLCLGNIPLLDAGSMPRQPIADFVHNFRTNLDSTRTPNLFQHPRLNFATRFELTAMFSNDFDLNRDHSPIYVFCAGFDTLNAK
jgi:hypothetical protein